MKQQIIRMLAACPEGRLGSVIAASISGGCDEVREQVWDTLMDMLAVGEVVSKPRVFRRGEKADNDILFALPSPGVVRVAPNRH